MCWQDYTDWINYWSQRVRGREEHYHSHGKTSACGHLAASFHLSWECLGGSPGAAELSCTSSCTNSVNWIHSQAIQKKQEVVIYHTSSKRQNEQKTGCRSDAVNLKSTGSYFFFPPFLFFFFFKHMKLSYRHHIKCTLTLWNSCIVGNKGQC